MEPLQDFNKLHPEVQKYILESVRRAGSAKGACKRRGGTEYYVALAKKRKAAQEAEAKKVAAAKGSS